jgi:hypothetical protein
MFSKPKSPEELADKERQRAQKEREKAERKAQREHEAFLQTPVGQARSAFARGDDLFQYAHDVDDQDSVILNMIGKATGRRSSDPCEILNAVAREGWELVNGSFVFRQKSLQRATSSVPRERSRARPLGYYLFRRAATRTPRALGDIGEQGGLRDTT